MAMTLSELGILLTPKPMSFEFKSKNEENSADSKYYYRKHGTEVYIDEDGDKSCFLVVDLCNNGECILILSP